MTNYNEHYVFTSYQDNNSKDYLNNFSLKMDKHFTILKKYTRTLEEFIPVNSSPRLFRTVLPGPDFGTNVSLWESSN